MCSLKLLLSCRVRLGSLRLAIWQSVSQSVSSVIQSSVLSDSLPSQLCLTLGDPKVHACVICISGMADVPGCGHRLHSRGVGMPGPQSAGLVQGGDVRELQEPGLLGWTQLPSRIAYLPYEVLVPSFLEWLLKLSASHSGFRSLLSRGKSVSLSLERKASWWFAMLVSFFFPDVLCLFHSRWVVILYILWY